MLLSLWQVATLLRKLTVLYCPNCGTVALDGPFFFLFFLADHRATDFTLSKICGTATKNSSHLSTVIFTTKRFVRAESCGSWITRFVTYLSIAPFSYLLTYYYSFLAHYNKTCFDINWFHLLSPAIFRGGFRGGVRPP